MLPIGRVSNGVHAVSVPLEWITDWSTSLGIPDSNSTVVGSGYDVVPIGRVSNGVHPASVPLEWITAWRASLGIPDSNSTVVGSGDDVLPIGRVSNGVHLASVPLERVMMDIAVDMGVVGTHMGTWWSDEFRSAPPSAQELSLGLEFFLPSLVLPHRFEAGKPDIAGLKKSKGDAETTKGMHSPNFIIVMNITTNEWFMRQVARAEVADRALQITILHITAPKTLAHFPIDLDEY